MRKFVMHEPQQAWQVLMRAWEFAKPMLTAGNKLELVLREPTRNLDQNALLHAELSDIAKTMTWAGKRWSAEDWKRLMTCAWMRARHQSATMVPALDGHGFDVLYRHTSTLTKSEFSELIEYVKCWRAEREAVA